MNSTEIASSNQVNLQTPVEKSGDYVALIFYPQKLVNQRANASFFNNDNTVNARIRVGQAFQFLDPFSPYPQYITFILHPGTNLGYHIRKEDDTEIIQHLWIEYWDAILKNPANKKLLKAIEVIKPNSDRYDDLDEPGYRNFDSEDAIKLCQHHFAESWIQRASIGENRATVLKVAEEMKTAIKEEFNARLSAS